MGGADEPDARSAPDAVDSGRAGGMGLAEDGRAAGMGGMEPEARTGPDGPDAGRD
ncbi:hypothetical protein ACIRJO_34240 [Streptomyces sp. NPDC102394]|uniref:hypothetical protein n=1 Tax=Streptomyces sp. NPDC102394 TaxID=3366167 RepID=UPI003824A774